MKRNLPFFLTGLIFGIVDWFFTLRMAAHSTNSLDDPAKNALVTVLNLAVWLLPILPTVIFEAKRSSSIKNSVRAGIVVWSSAMLGYYLTYAIQISLGNVEGWKHLNIFAGKEGDFWGNYWSVMQSIVLKEFLEWIWVAILGGAIVGALGHWLFGRRDRANANSMKQ